MKVRTDERRTEVEGALMFRYGAALAADALMTLKYRDVAVAVFAQEMSHRQAARTGTDDHESRMARDRS